jgi:hypothetical protein
MAAEQPTTGHPTWLVNDVVAYDAMRELSGSVQAHLLDRERHGDRAARAELLEIRRATLAVDGFDRAAVDAFSAQLRRRNTELAQSTDGR